jgi:hypothetical protein
MRISGCDFRVKFLRVRVKDFGSQVKVLGFRV